MCVQLLVPYCCDNPEAKNRSTARHGVTVNKPFAKFMVIGEEIMSIEMADEISVGNAKMIQERFLKMLRNHTWSVESGDE